jgi:hypothetical protein
MQRLPLGGYEYNLDTQKVTLNKEDINADLDEHWEQSMKASYMGKFSDDKDEEEDNVYVIDIRQIILDVQMTTIIEFWMMLLWHQWNLLLKPRE